METARQLIPILLTLSLGLLVVAIGMGSERGDLTYVLRRPRMLGRAILAVDVLPVLAAIGVTSLMTWLSVPSRAAILLMAISPVPPLVPGKSLKFGGRREYVYGLQIAMVVLSLVSVPLLGNITAALYGSRAEFPLWVLVRNLVSGLLIPLAIGLALGRWLAPDFSKRFAPTLAKIALIMVFVTIVPILIVAWRPMIGLLGDGTLLAMAIVIGLAMLGGYVVGQKEPGDRAALVFASAMRHPGIALALIGANNANRTIVAGVLLFLFVGLFALIPYQILLKRSTKAEPAPA
jgi:BASS family bile acid:Na+ symporter